MAVQHITKADFQKVVLDSDTPIFVDFYAEWCGPCKMTEPIVEQLSEEMKDVKFVKIDVDNDQDLASDYSVFSIPTFMIFKNKGKVAGQFVGAMGKEGFLDEIKKAKVS
jgi:thioredoxin 1